jgi:hypothetical protein
MIVVRFLGTVASVILAAIAGNLLGGQIRLMVSEEPDELEQLVERDEAGQLSLNMQAIESGILPAILAAFVGKPRWLFAFLGGLIYSGLFDKDSQKLLGSGLRLFK